MENDTVAKEPEAETADTSGLVFVFLIYKRIYQKIADLKEFLWSVIHNLLKEQMKNASLIRMINCQIKKLVRILKRLAP